jgi:hypothetical protein
LRNFVIFMVDINEETVEELWRKRNAQTYDLRICS